MGEIMKDDDYKAICRKEVKIHLHRRKQSERSELVKESQHLRSDKKACSSPKIDWSNVPFVSVDKISIDQPTDWNGRSIGSFFSSYEPISGGDSQVFTNDTSVTNRSTAGQSGDGPTDVGADCQLDDAVLINGKSPTISLERLSLSSNHDCNSNFKGRKLTFDDQALPNKKTLFDSESLLKQYSPTVSLKRLSLPLQLSGKEKVNNDSVNFGNVEEEPIAMPSRHRRRLRKKWLQSKLKGKRSSRGSAPIVGKSWQEEVRISQTKWRVETASTGPKVTGRSVSPVICEVGRKLRGRGHERSQMKGKRSIARGNVRVKVSDKRKFDAFAKSENCKELIKRQKLKHAAAKENGDNKDGVSVIPENDQKERKDLEYTSRMSVTGEKKSSRENGKVNDERRDEVSDKKTSTVLDKHGRLKEHGKNQKFKLKDVKENGQSEHGSVVSQEGESSMIPENSKGREIGQGSTEISVRSGENSSPEDKNAGIFHKLSEEKGVIRPSRKSYNRQLLPSHVAAVLMKPRKPKKREQEDDSETVDQNGIEQKLHVKLGHDKSEVTEKSGTGEENLKESSTENVTEKPICITERKLTEKKYAGTMTEERVEKRLEGEKKMMEEKLEGGVSRKKVEYIDLDERVNGFQSVRKNQRESSCHKRRSHTPEKNGKNERKDPSKALQREDAVKIEGSVQSVRKEQTEANSHEKIYTSYATGKCDIEGASKTSSRKDSIELDYLSNFCRLTAKCHKEKENDPGRILGVRDSTCVPPAVTDHGFTLSKVEKNSIASISKEGRNKEYKEKLKFKLEEVIERTIKDTELQTKDERKWNVPQIVPGPESFVGKKEVECNENLGGELQSKGEMKSKLKSALPTGKQKSESNTSANELSVVQSHSIGEDLPDSGTINNSQQLNDDPVSLLNVPPTKEEHLTEGDDDDVVFEFIKSPKTVSAQQILVFMDGLFQTQDARTVPSPEEIVHKLNKTYGKNMSHWESFVKDHWELIVASRVGTISSARQEKPLATVGKYSLTETDMASLENASWLNDNIINSYLHLLSKEAPLRNAAFSSFFFQVYLKNGFEHVQRWHRKIDIFACRLILVPIHSRHHWCLVAVDNKEKTIIFFDSMRSGGTRYLMKIKAYMNEEAVARQNTPIEWDLQSKEGIPKQRNTSDCGVFVCQYAKRLCYGKQVTFSHSEASHFRQLMKKELLTKKLEPP